MQRTRAREMLLACAFVFCACEKRESVATMTAPVVSASAPLPALTASSESPEQEAEREAAHRAAIREAAEFGMVSDRDTDFMHVAESPSVVVGTVRVGGPLEPDVVKGIIRDHAREYRLCYRDGLKKNPALQGRVTAKFVLDQNGLVRGSAQDAGSDLADHDVVQCVLLALSNLAYPQPRGGLVAVEAPILLSPGPSR